MDHYSFLVPVWLQQHHQCQGGVTNTNFHVECQASTTNSSSRFQASSTNMSSQYQTSTTLQQQTEDVSYVQLQRKERQMKITKEKRMRRRNWRQRRVTNTTDSESDSEDESENGKTSRQSKHHPENKGRVPCFENHDTYSYDGDESDDCNQSSSSGCYSDDNLFFNCKTQQPSPAHCTSNNGHAHFDQPIEALAIEEPKPLKWWESEGEDDCHGIKTLPSSVSPSTQGHGHVRIDNYHQSTPTLVDTRVENTRVMEIWGSDFFTDSFSEMSSDSDSDSDSEPDSDDNDWETENDQLKIPNKLHSNMSTGKPVTQNVFAHTSGKHIQSSELAANLHSQPTSLSNYNCIRALTHTNQNVLNSFTSKRPSPSQSISSAADTTYATANIAKTEIRDCNWSLTRVRLSSDDSWVTANEDWELGTLV